MKRNKITLDVFFDFSNPYSYIGLKIFKTARDFFQSANPGVRIVTNFHSSPSLPSYRDTLLISEMKKENPNEFSELNSLKKMGSELGCNIDNWVYFSNSFPAFLLLKAAPLKVKEDLIDDIFNMVFEEGEDISDTSSLNILAQKYKINNWGWNTVQNVIGQYDVSKKHYLIKDYPRFTFNGKINLVGIIPVNVFLDNFKSVI